MIEKEKLFEERCGLRIGESYWIAANWGGLMAKLIVFKNKIIIEYGESKIVLKKEEILSLEKYDGALKFLGVGIKVNHKKRNIPPFIIIWAWSRDELFDKLKKLGYKTK